jgi:hypothetical protein
MRFRALLDSVPIFMMCSISIWLAIVECCAEAWYRAHERNLKPPVHWTIQVPPDRLNFQELPFSASTRQMLRFDEGRNLTWRESNGLTYQAIFLRWNPGHTATRLANNHTPEDCLAAAGRELVALAPLQLIYTHGYAFPFRFYEVRDQRGPLFVLYCLWDDRALDRSFAPEWLSYRNRLRSVLAGRRNCGRRSLELAIWGVCDAQVAQTAIADILPAIIKMEN